MQVFVTVGTTSFDALIETVSSLPVKKVNDLTNMIIFLLIDN